MVCSNGVFRNGRKRDRLVAWSSCSYENIGTLSPKPIKLWYANFRFLFLFCYHTASAPITIGTPDRWGRKISTLFLVLI